MLLVHHVLGIGAMLYGGNFAVRRDGARARLAASISAIEFHGEDTNLGPAPDAASAASSCAAECWVWTSARRYRAMGKRHGLRPVRAQLLVRDPSASSGGSSTIWT